MRTQPQTIIQRLEADNSRLAKEAILAEAMNEGLDEFFEGLRMCLDNMYTFGVKQVPIREGEEGQGLAWANFKSLAESLYYRTLTGHAARDAIKLAMDVATNDQWNGFYRRILIKDLRCGVSEKTVNSVAKKQKKPQYAVPVFECMLAHDGANHQDKIEGEKFLQPKLDGVRCLTVVNVETGTVTQYTRNGKVLENFSHITDAILEHIPSFTESVVLDGEIVSRSFQDLMKQVHRKSDVKANDARLMLFDIIPLGEFKAGKGTKPQDERHRELVSFSKVFESIGNIDVIPQVQVDLDSFVGREEYKEYNKKIIEQGFEGIMIKDPDAVYECKRSTAWLKEKPFIEVSLSVVAVEEGTGRNEGRLGALVCEGLDDGKNISVNVGSGFTDDARSEFWQSYLDNPSSVIGQVVEVRADAATRNQDSEDVYSLRFPRFLRFRGFAKGEKI